MLGIGVIFFVIGLDDGNDPGRVFHGTWHMLAGSASYWLWRIVAVPAKAPTYGTQV